MRRHLLTFIILLIGFIVNAQYLFDPGSIKLEKQIPPKEVKVYIDSSKSMSGYFHVNSVKSSLDKEVIYDWLVHLDQMKEDVKYYGFSSECSDKPIANSSTEFRTKIKDKDFFNGKENIYSSALLSMKSKNNSDNITIMLTDGIPSIIDLDKINVDAATAHKNERDGIRKTIHDFLEESESNTVVLARFFAYFNGNYYSADNSLSGVQKFKGKRNIYALVFCTVNQMEYVNELFNIPETKLDTKVLKYNIEDQIKGLNLKKGIATKSNGNVVIEAVLKVKNNFDSEQIAGFYDSKNNKFDILDSTSVIKNASDNTNSLVYKVEIPKAYLLNKPFDIRFEINNNSGFFESLNARDVEKEKEVFENNQNYFNKTFRLNYLLDGVLDNMRNKKYAAHLEFNILETNHWVSYFEPLFGIINPNASQDFINQQLIPLFLFLYRWLTPLLFSILIYLVIFNYKLLNINEETIQKKIWYAGLILSVLIVLFSAFYYMILADYGDVKIQSMTYKIKHLVASPLIAGIIYLISSLILKRTPNNTAQNTPF